MTGLVHLPRTLLAMVSVLALAACAGDGRRAVIDNGTSIEPGMIAVLHERLLIPAHDTRAYIQNGQPIHGKNVDQYHAYCRINLTTLADKPRHIEPGRFLIERIGRTVEMVRARPRQLASSVMVGADSATADEYHTIIDLQSETQPEVEMLLCSHWEDPTLFPEHLNAEQIRHTLKPLITFEKP